MNGAPNPLMQQMPMVKNMYPTFPNPAGIGNQMGYDVPITKPEQILMAPTDQARDLTSQDVMPMQSPWGL